MTCQHEEFHCDAAVGRLSTVEGGPITHYCAGVTIKCRQCDQRFQFVGLPMGMSAYRPTVSIDGTELRAPLMPQGQRPPAGLPGYGVQMSETEQ